MAGIRTCDRESQVQRPNHYTTEPRISTPAKDGDKFRSIFSDNLQPIATRGKKARSTLLVDQHCGNGCSIKRAPLSVSYYNEISGGYIGSSVVRRRGSVGPALPLWIHGSDDADDVDFVL